MGATIIERENAGIDTVLSSVGFRLGHTIEHLVLIGERTIGATATGVFQHLSRTLEQRH